MKTLLFLILLASCTQKYADFDLIRKVDFNKETYERPIPATQVLAQGQDELGECFNQWLFFSNAEKQKDINFPTMIRVLCPGKEYLVQTEVKETWWTTILFTRSCVDIKTKCGQPRALK
jgi:hypothetical protein